MSSNDDAAHWLSPRRVLVVDDTAGTAKITARLFQFNGHQTELAQNGQEALAAIEAFEPEIIILDLSLPDWDGFEVAIRARQLPAGRDCLMVALTGHDQVEYRRRATNAGFDEYLVKPADSAELEKLTVHPKLTGRDDAP